MSGVRSLLVREKESALVHISSEHPQAALGCSVCPDRGICGGLQVSYPALDCTAYCCGREDICDLVCCNNSESFAPRIWEIDGFTLDNVNRTAPVQAPSAPSLIPFIYHNGTANPELDAPIVALRLFRLVNLRTGQPRFADRRELAQAFGLREDTKIILSGTATDNLLERWWALGERRQLFVRYLADLGVEAVTAPNYSLFSNVPRWDNLHNIKRIAIAWLEFMEGGVHAALHVNARTDLDWQRWAEFVQVRQEVTSLAYEFATGAGRSTRRAWHAENLARVAERARRPMNLFLRGGWDQLEVLRKSFSQISVIDTSCFMKTVKRQAASLVPNKRGIRWESCKTEPSAPLGDLMSHNLRMLQKYISETT